ncbi:MAG: low temperature requirement protein A [Actinobacteria bacterium]|nr:MAG: low temperature requirement protein A [Actinomycetota bacterium]
MAASEREERVTPLELFFDLVFVFAITQVTSMLSVDPTWAGLGRALLVLGALWWAWTGYAWLTNNVNPDEGAVRLAILGAMGALLVVALAVPNSFGDDGVLFGVAYFSVRLLHIVLFVLAARGDRAMLGSVFRLAIGSTIGPVLIIVAGFTDGGAQAALWTIALTLDYLGGAFSSGGWRVSPRHFAERHGLIIIIALGESIVAIGVGARGEALDAGVIGAALLGIAVVTALWWAYFDVVALVAERKLSEASGIAQAALARDTYSYLHLPMVAGIVLFALALKRTLAHVGDDLDTVRAFALCCGPAMYLLAHDAMRFRTDRTYNSRRLLTVVVLVALLPAALSLPALGALAGVTAACWALVVWEALRHSGTRARIRHA